MSFSKYLTGHLSVPVSNAFGLKALLWPQRLSPARVLVLLSVYFYIPIFQLAMSKVYQKLLLYVKINVRLYKDNRTN